MGLLLCPGSALAQFNPFGALGKVLTTSMDVRSKSEVGTDTEIAAAASKRLLDDKKSEWAGVTLLVFAQHVVIAGAVKTEAVKHRVEELVRQDKRIRALKNELLVGEGGSSVGGTARDTALEAEINASLTAAKGVSSVNMRWCATGGRVVLMGIAQSQQEAGLAATKVRAIKGVKTLVSHLRVTALKK